MIPSIPHASATSEWQGGFAFAGSSQMVPPMRIEDGSSQFLPGHAAFSVSMPIFPTGMNDQWHGASYNIALYIIAAPAEDVPNVHK
uniref:Uncharacterized protein n=1 Tax=Oryza barthii TaxID=65489 RepID=A0A0D3ERX7_9ORYZ